jgi:hypothetical protein
MNVTARFWMPTSRLASITTRWSVSGVSAAKASPLHPRT